MAANTSPIFTLTPNCKSIVGTATANTSRTTFATGFDIITGATAGTRVEGVVFTAAGTTTAGTIRIWHRINGGSDIMIGEISVSAVTPSATVQVWTGYWKPTITPFVLTASDKISFTTHNAEAFNATPVAGDY
jgi:hypothetical protein